jgi:dipeptidyl aminopeptidase/acylaminoacyl peptidase
MTPLSRRSGADHAPVPSPDGKLVAFVGFEDRGRSYENARLYLMDRDGSHVRSLTDGIDRSMDSAQWTADGRSLLVSYEDRAETRIVRVGLDGRMQSLLSAPMGSELDRPYQGHGAGAFSVARNGTIAFTRASGTRPADVAVLQGGRERRLTLLNEDLLAGRALAVPAPLAVKSSFDGRAVDAWLAIPAATPADRKLPLILEIHGGPFSNYGDVFSTDVQLYAAAGYAVLYVNPRGSTSYGDEFANLIHHDYPGHDYDDLISAVDAAIAAGRIDPEQLFVTGGSGGGVLSAWIIGKTHRFRAAAVQKPIINWTAAALTTDFYPYLTRYWFGKMPWEDPEGYWKRSPLSLVGNVTTPTIVIVGDRDYRTPVSDSEQYYQALQLRRVPTALIKVPGASHGGLAARPSQSAAKASAILAWFDRWRATASR